MKIQYLIKLNGNEETVIFSTSLKAAIAKFKRSHDFGTRPNFASFVKVTAEPTCDIPGRTF